MIQTVDQCHETYIIRYVDSVSLIGATNACLDPFMLLVSMGI